MEFTDTLENAIESKNTSRMHSVFYTIAHEDPAFASGKYEKILNYVKSLNIDGFIVEHNGEEFAPFEKWDEDYWATVVSELQDNFSQERIDHLIEVGKYVYGSKKNVKAVDKDHGKTSEKEHIKIPKSGVSNDGKHRTSEKRVSKNSSIRGSSGTKNSSADDSDIPLLLTGIALGVGILMLLLRGRR